MRGTSAIAIFEAAAGLARIANSPPADTLAVVDRFLAEIGATIQGIDRTTGALALEAFARFGKGRDAAALNMGDCFAYACACACACAKKSGVPLLCKGNDFPQTDIALG